MTWHVRKEWINKWKYLSVFCLCPRCLKFVGFAIKSSLEWWKITSVSNLHKMITHVLHKSTLRVFIIWLSLWTMIVNDLFVKSTHFGKQGFVGTNGCVVIKWLISNYSCGIDTLIDLPLSTTGKNIEWKMWYLHKTEAIHCQLLHLNLTNLRLQFFRIHVYLSQVVMFKC